MIDPLPPELAAAPVTEHAELIRKLLAQCIDGGLYCEFGVASGGSLAWLVANSNKVWHGFDSFTGLPEAWNGLPKGHFAFNGVPVIDRAIIHRGMFAETLPAFVQEHREDKIAFAHIDCDLYSSTKTVLENLKPLFVEGSLLLFDEYFGYDGWREHEHKALLESGIPFEYVGRDEYTRMAVRIM
jgi:hypothetical protein